MNQPLDSVRATIESLGLTYTDKFAEPLRERLAEKQYVGGVRSSKTTHGCLEVLIRVPRWLARNMQSRSVEEPEGRETLVWLVGNTYLLTQQEFDLLAKWSRRIGLHISSSEAQEGGRVMKWRGNITIETRAADNEERLASKAPDLILACESGQISEKGRDNIRERALEKAAPIIWSGTLEDGEGKPVWLWYEEQAQAWQDNPTRRHKCWSLPTWENPLWATCLPWVTEDETGTLAELCPDSNHGESHSYWNHPQIEAYRRQYGVDTYEWRRRIAAEPTGVQFAVYKQLEERNFLLPMPQSSRMAVFASAGGIDYGTTNPHPSALTVVQLVDDPRDREPYFVGPRGIAWVRECIVLSDGGDTASLKRARKELSERWRVRQWNVDPNERFMAKNWEGENTSYSESARMGRHGIVRARLNMDKLFFDLSGPGVSDLYKEMKLVHYTKDKMGQLHPYRMRDDRTASMEDAVEALDGEKSLVLPPPSRIKTYARRTATMSPV